MSVQGFISSQEEPHREIMIILRSWILDLGPHVQEKISYSIPYFYFFGPLCYLSPGKQGVDLAFTKGKELEDEGRILEPKGRLRIRSKTFYSTAEVEEYEDQVRRLLNEAAILNEYHFKQRQKRKQVKR